MSSWFLIPHCIVRCLQYPDSGMHSIYTEFKMFSMCYTDLYVPYIKCAEIPCDRLLWRLNFVGRQYRLCFISPLWRLEF